MILPKNILFTRNNAPLGRIALYLRKKGHNVNLLHANGLKIIKSLKKIPKDTLIMVWSGPYRKVTKDKYSQSPNIAHMEQGFLPHYESFSFDTDGHCATSSIPGCTLDDYSVSNQKLVDKYLEQHYFRGLKSSNAIPAMPKPPYVLFPLQHIKDSVMMFDTPKWTTDYNTVIGELCQTLPKGCTLVVKQHPKHRSGITLHQNSKYPIFFIDVLPDNVNHAMNRYLLENSKYIISINSSFILEALAHKIPVITLGRGIFTGHEVVKEYYDNGINNTLFNGATFNSKQVYRFLYEICINRQIAKSDTSNHEIVDRVWSGFEKRYAEKWS